MITMTPKEYEEVSKLTVYLLKESLVLSEDQFSVLRDQLELTFDFVEGGLEFTDFMLKVEGLKDKYVR